MRKVIVVLLIIAWSASAVMNVCPNNCTGQPCVLGECHCNITFLGLDCSISNISKASLPSGFSLSFAVDSVYLYLRFVWPGNGWASIAFGTSSDGMTGGDMLFVTNTTCEDRYATGQVIPQRDTQQDCEGFYTLSNTQTKTVTVRRKLNTNDNNVDGSIQHDQIIVPGSTAVSWALGPSMNMDQQHKQKQCGKAVINFFTGEVTGYPSQKPLQILAFVVGFLVAVIGSLCIGRARTSSRTRLSQWLHHRRLGSAKLRKWFDRLTFNFIPTIVSLTLGELMIILLYIASLISYILIAQKTYSDANNDFLLVTGDLAAIHLMFTLLLPTKNSVWLLLFGIPYERVIKYHRWIARIFLIFSTLHFIAMMRQKQRVEMTGLISYIIFCVVILTSIELVRRKKYNLFFYTHFLSWIGVIFAVIHARLIIVFVLVPILLYIVDYIIRYQKISKVKLLSATKFSYGMETGDTIIELKFACEKQPLKFTAGDYVFLTIPNIGIESHPFTISSSPSRDGNNQFTLHIKTMGPNTWTERAALSLINQKSSLDWKFYIEGPYGGLSVNAFENYPVVVLCAGGIGVSPMISILSELHNRYLAGTVSHLVEIHFVWVCSSPIPFKEWFNSILQTIHRNNMNNIVRFYFYSTDRKSNREATNDKESIEMENGVSATNQKNSTAEAKENNQNVSAPDIPISKGRPDYKSILGDIDQTVRKRNLSSHDVAVLCCGPTSMVNRVMHAAQCYYFHLHRETFYF